MACRALITGASGFIGKALVQRLSVNAPELDVIGWGGPVSDAAAVDLTDGEAVQLACNQLQPSVVVHLAARSSVAESSSAAEDVWRTNFLGTWNLAAALAKAAPQCTFINAGSAEQYGASFLVGEPLAEGAPFLPMNPYAKSKAASELVLEDLMPSTARLVLLRLFNHTGPGQDERFVAPSFAAQIARIEKTGRPGVISVGDLSAERDFGHVDDLVRALIMIIQGRERLGPLSQFNICSGRSRPVEDVLKTLVGLATQPVAIEVDSSRMRPSAIQKAAGSHAAISEALGWQPEISFEETMRSVLDYWRTIV